MVSLEKNMYILKQSDSTIWKFSYDKNFGIIYETCRKDIWSDYNILTQTSTGNFSVDLLKDDKICLIYEDLDGNLIIYLYDNIKWQSHYISRNNKKNKINIYFKTLSFKNDLILFYSIYNSNSNILTIASQLIDENRNLNSPTLIDKINLDYDTPFYLYVSKENKLYIMYQKQENNHLLGYKVLNNYSMPWSKFNIIDKGSSPFKEYSLLCLKNTIHCLYIKKDYDNSPSLIHYKRNFSFYKYQNISYDNNIISSAFFIVGEHIWCMWIRNNEIYSSVSIDDGDTFSNPPQLEELLDSSIFKGTYISNSLENGKGICIGEIFIQSSGFPQILVLDNIYGIIHRSYKNSSYLFYFQYLLSNTNKEDNYQSYNKENDYLIEHLNNVIKEQENNLLSYENKLKLINNNLKTFNDNKNELTKGIQLLQSNLEAKEKRLDELEIIYSEKEKELEILKKELNNVNPQEIDSFDLKKIFDKFSSFFKS